MVVWLWGSTPEAKIWVHTLGVHQLRICVTWASPISSLALSVQVGDGISQVISEVPSASGILRLWAQGVGPVGGPG